MTVEEIESAKADIQSRIDCGDPESSRRVARTIRPLDDAEAQEPPNRACALARKRQGADDSQPSEDDRYTHSLVRYNRILGSRLRFDGCSHTGVRAQGSGGGHGAALLRR